VGEPAAEWRTSHAGQLNEERCGEPRHREAEIELLVEECRHPGEQHHTDEVIEHKRSHTEEHGWGSPDNLEKLRNRHVHSLMFGDLKILEVCRPAWRLDEDLPQHKPKYDTQPAEHDE